MSAGKRAALALLLCGVVYPPAKLYWAERQVTSFCNDVVAGTSVDELERKAKDAWLEIKKLPASTLEGKPVPAKLLVWEGFAFGRWFCEIDHTDGKADAKRVSELD
jgi:hypothetical protein